MDGGKCRRMADRKGNQCRGVFLSAIGASARHAARRGENLPADARSVKGTGGCLRGKILDAAKTIEGLGRAEAEAEFREHHRVEA
jgi:hypothetical protein